MVDFGRLDGGFVVSLAKGAADLEAAQRLRYTVFVEELGGTGAGVDHAARRETDMFDDYADHLLLRPSGLDEVVGVYRLMTEDMAAAAGRFYSESEYDLAPLRRSGRRLLELGRSCLRADYRGTTAMRHLWAGLTAYVETHEAEMLFGVASLAGTDLSVLAQPLSVLHHRFLAPEDVRPRAWVHQPMDVLPETQLDRRAAMVALPPLIKGYLRLGGRVGDGAFVDHAFNCTDVCMILEAAHLARGADPGGALR